jgi:aldehyde dehydrogenase (NAD(P)+)
LIRDVDPRDRDDIAFRREAWCGLAAETALSAESIPAYIERAVRFANEVLWGSLCATLIVHPASLKDPQIAAAVEQAIADLAYGTVSVNAFVFYSAYLATTPWGGYPGHTIRDIQSGIGKSYNFLLFDRPQKSVLRAPFQRLDPITVKAKRPHRFAKRLAYYEYEPSVGKLPGLLWAALRS